MAAPIEEVGLINAMRYLDLKLTLAGGILVKVDGASMAVSLEARPVFLNREAEVLVTGDADCYAPTREANTHWLHWPEGGTS